MTTMLPAAEAPERAMPKARHSQVDELAVSSTAVFSVGSQEDWNLGFPAMYPRFSRMLEEAGVPPRFFLRRERGVEASLAGQRSIVLDNTVFFDQGEGAIERLLHDAIADGARVLCVCHPGNDSARATLNRVLERYGLVFTGERHFRLERYAGNGVAGGVPRDQLPVVPADIIAATDGLAAGVAEVVFSHRASAPAPAAIGPLLWALSNPDRVDLKDIRREPLDDDDVVAQSWAPAGQEDPSLVVVGDGTWILDELIVRADNEILARNLVGWLSGATSGAALAAEAGSLIDRIELTLWDLALRRLGLIHGPLRNEEISKLLPQERVAEASSADDYVRFSLTLSDKVNVLCKARGLEDVYTVAVTSKNQARSRWARVIELRNRVSHAERRAANPVTDKEVETLRALDRELTALWRSHLAESVLDDPLTSPAES